jgi:hypothetical protein
MQKNDINKIAKSDASEITHYLKEEGNGSMKRGLINLLNYAEENLRLSDALEKSNESGKIKDVAIIGLGLVLTGTIIKMFSDNKKMLKEKDKVEEIEDVKDMVEKMSDEEVEELVTNTIEENEETE